MAAKKLKPAALPGRRPRPLVVEGAGARAVRPRHPVAVVSIYPTPESLFRRVDRRPSRRSRFAWNGRRQMNEASWVNRNVRDAGLGPPPLEDLALDPSDIGDIGGHGDDVTIYTAARIRYSRELIRRAGHAW